MALQHEAAGAGLADDVQARATADQAAQRLGHRLQAAGDRAQVLGPGVALGAAQVAMSTLSLWTSRPT